MTVALILITDGRPDYHGPCLDSLDDALPRHYVDQIIHVDDPEHRLGFAGAIQAAWDKVETDWVLHVEADFTFHRPIPLHSMIAVLGRNPELAQLVLKRQAWNPQERAAGGIIEQHPDEYTERRDDHGHVWTEHRKFWSTNPCVYSSRWCRVGWPQEPESEGMFTHKLLRDPLLHFGFWGAKAALPLVEHIGRERAGTGY